MEPWTTVWLFIYNTTYRYKYYNTKINMTPPGKSSYPFLIQQNIHWMQHPKVATYPEVTTFSCNQTELTTKVGICCNFFSERELLSGCNFLHFAIFPLFFNFLLNFFFHINLIFYIYLIFKKDFLILKVNI